MVQKYSRWPCLDLKSLLNIHMESEHHVIDVISYHFMLWSEVPIIIISCIYIYTLSFQPRSQIQSLPLPRFPNFCPQARFLKQWFMQNLYITWSNQRNITSWMASDSKVLPIASFPSRLQEAFARWFQHHLDFLTGSGWFGKIFHLWFPSIPYLKYTGWCPIVR